MKKRFQTLFFLCLATVFFACSLSCPALAAVPDRPQNQYVLDSADVLSDATEQEIVSENQKLFRDTGAEIVVAAVDFLGGEDIEDYVYDMFNSWGVGSQERNNGLLLVLAIAEDNYYVQPGYGIEDYFTGSKLQDLLDQYLEPDFAAGDYDAGVKKFFSAALSEMESYYRDYEDEYTQDKNFNQGGSYYNYSQYGGYGQSGSGFSLGSVLGGFVSIIVRVVVLIVVVLVIVALIRAISGGGGRGPRGGGGGGGGFWTGMFLGNMLGGRRSRRWYNPPPPGGFGGPMPPRPPRGGSGFGGFGRPGGFSGGGHSRGGGFGRSGGFHGGGGSRGGGAGRR